MERKSAVEMVAEALLTAVASVLIGALMLMTAVRVAHDHWIPQLPTIGYWWAALLVLLLRGVFSAAPKIERHRSPR